MSLNDPLATRKSEKDDPPSIHLRRLRDAPLDTLQRLTDEIGHRPATSLAEARAAALLDGRLRRAGLQVIADTFMVIPEPGWAGIILGVLALVAFITYYWLPFLTLGFVVILILVAGIALWQPSLLAGKPRPSQNVVGNRAASDQQHTRLVLLARLDTPLTPALLTRALGGHLVIILRLAATLLIALFALIGLFNPQRLWLYLMVLPTLYLVLAALLDLLTLRPIGPAQPQHSAGIAVLLATCEQLDTLEHTELWAVGLGATARATGLFDLLRRYPFDQASTLFVALEGLGSGAPAIITSEGWPRSQQADHQLVETLVQIVNEWKPPLAQISYGAPTIVAPLLQAGRRTISLACLGPGHTPVIDQEYLEGATRLVIELAYTIDRWSEDT